MNTAEARGAGRSRPRVRIPAELCREFVERLGRAAQFVAPVVAAVALPTPKAMGVYP